MLHLQAFPDLAHRLRAHALTFNLELIELIKLVFACMQILKPVNFSVKQHQLLTLVIDMHQRMTQSHAVKQHAYTSHY